MPRPIRTLGDARDRGLRLVAVCDNPACRHRRDLDLALIIDHVGARHSVVPLKGQVHYSEMLSCQQCGGKGAFIWIAELPDVKPMFAGLSYLINRWPSPDSHTLIETVVRAGSEQVANVAFDASITHYPGDYLTLQQRSRVIRDNRFRVVIGGRKRG